MLSKWISLSHNLMSTSNQFFFKENNISKFNFNYSLNSTNIKVELEYEHVGRKC